MQQRARLQFRAPMRSQRGAALLIFLIIAVLGSASYMLADFNTHLSAPRVTDAVQSRNALREAREALLGAATAVVDDAGAIEVRPGQLPWPDRAADGNYDGRSDCIAVQASNLLGRFPYLGSGNCIHVTTVALNAYVEDGAGEPLWYALSKNVAYYDASADAPAAARFGDRLKISPALVDAPTYPWMRVCDASGNLVAANVAAVIIAPGPALSGQARVDATPAASEYLDTITIGGVQLSNADSDELPDAPALCDGAATGGEDFVAPIGLTDAQRSEFNDHLIYITAEELLDAVQTRAMNAVGNALNAHVQAHGRMPWLSPFANAEAGTPIFSGTVNVAGATTFTSDAPPAGDIDVLFTAAGLSGAAVRNATDGSTAQIVAVAGNVVTTTGLIGGTNNTWQVGDVFQIPTFRGDPGTRFGQVPFHDPEVAEDRRADFSVLWSLQAANVAEVEVSPIVNAHAPYTTTLTAAALSTALSGAVTVGNGTFNAVAGSLSGVCRQVGQTAALNELALGEGYARCQGRALTRVGYLAVESGQGDATELLADSVADADLAAFDFAAWGVERGDLVTNVTDGSRGIVATVGVGGDVMRLAVANLSGGINNAFAERDDVTVQIASRSLASIATGGSATTLVDGSADFIGAGVAVDDIVVNEDDGSTAFVTAVTSASELQLTALSGGAGNTFSVTDNYTIRGGFVARRQITFDLLFLGARDAGPLLSENVYSVRSNTTGGQDLIRQPLPDLTVAEDVQDAAIHVQDFDSGNNLVGEVKVRLDAASTGYLEVRNIEEDFFLSTGNAVADSVNGVDLPRWIYEQGWHEYIAVAVGSEFQPDGDGACDNAGDCLTVTAYDTQSTANANAFVPAVILGAGIHVGGAAPPRPTALLSAYFEGANGDGNFDNFEQSRFNPAAAVNFINDRLAIP